MRQPNAEELIVGQPARQQRETRRPRRRTRAAHRAAETSRTTRACRAARSRSRAAPRRPIRHRDRAPARIGTARAAAAPRRRCVAYVGSRPIVTVDRPIVSSAATSVVLRPTRSPKCPNSADPIGRARNAIAKVASDASVADGRIGRWKEQPREDEDRRGRVDVEVEELDGGADQAREQDLRGCVDGGSGLSHAGQILPYFARPRVGRRNQSASSPPRLSTRAGSGMMPFSIGLRKAPTSRRRRAASGHHRDRRAAGGERCRTLPRTT